MPWPSPDGAIRRTLRSVVYSPPVLGTSLGYRVWLRRHGAAGPFGRPAAAWTNAVLKTRQEWKQAMQQARALGLPLHPTQEKHWDSVAMLARILDTTATDARIIDAGGALYSVMLPWLFLYGYRNLTAIDLMLPGSVRRGPIRYLPGDITRLDIADASVDVVICQSVLEHGVPRDRFLAEAARVLRTGGTLLLSVDYFDKAVDTSRIRDVDPGYEVFDPRSVENLLERADDAGLQLDGDIDLCCEDAAVNFDAFGISYTFLRLAFRRR